MKTTSNPFFQKHILKAESFSRADIEYLFGITENILTHQSLYQESLKGYIVATLFFEPSTRTYSSFVSATQRLGAGFIPIIGAENTSAQKGESFEHSIKTISQYADAIVIRHPDVGSAQEAAQSSNVPVINAGDGGGEHPTQALLDCFTIDKHLGSIDGKTITILGDLKHSRTMHSLALMLSVFKPAHINLVSPPSLKMPKHILDTLTKQNVLYSQQSDVESVIASTDVLYVNRVQKERLSENEDYEAIKKSFTVTNATIQPAKPSMIIMNPLPIVGDIAREVDDDPRAIYFEQVKYGMYLRMALLKSVLLEARE